MRAYGRTERAMSVVPAQRSGIRMRFPSRLRNPRVVAVLASLAASVLVCFACFVALINTKTMKQVIEEQVAKRLPPGYDCTYTVGSVSPFGAVELERITVTKDGRVFAFVDRCTASGLIGFVFGGGIELSCGRAFAYLHEVAGSGAGAPASGLDSAGTASRLDDLSLSLSAEKLTVVYGDFRDDWSVRLVWNASEKRVSAVAGNSSIDVSNIDFAKRSARIRARAIDTEKYIRFAPELEGRVRGIFGCDMRVTLGEGGEVLFAVARAGLEHATVSHALLDDTAVRLDYCGFSGSVFVSGTLQVVKGNAVFPGFEMPVSLYKRDNLVMGTIHAVKIPLDSIAKILEPSSGNLFTNFKMAGEANCSVTFSARLRDRISLERLRFTGSISNTKQLSSRLDFLKKQFYCYAFNEAGEIRRLTIGERNPLYVSFDKLPKYVYGAVLSCEDKGFFKHRGIDFGGIARAIRNNFSKKSEYLVGGSTLSQQLTKNLFLTKKKFLVRKLEELLLTCELEATLSKERILEIYLNAIELGRDIYGIGRAAQTYFGKSAYDLTALEAAYLASTLIKPRFFYDAFYEKNTISDYWQGRLKRLLNVMVTLEYLTPEVCAQNDPATFSFRTFGDAEIIVSSGEAGIVPAGESGTVPE